MTPFLKAAFLSTSVLAAVPAYAQMVDDAPPDKLDRFVCVTQDAEGDPAGLYKSPNSLYKQDGAQTLPARTQVFAGASIEGGNLYTRGEQALRESVQSYQERLDQNRLIVSPEQHRAQLEEWQKGLDAIRTGNSSCQNLVM